MTKLIDQVTNKCLESGKEYNYVSECLRFGIDKDSNDYKVIDFYSMSLDEIEEVLDIRKYDEDGHSVSEERIRTTICDDWYDVVSEIEYIKGMNDWNRVVSLLGYELINDNHNIKLYYSVYVSNS
ncbi:hypothetical protein [Siminovitchia fordii]|uniref:Uncharacterized protein n=1 Tax=Siminovitchia fordii TaxID=254759 RepID=A0ABQ4KBU0_9BACI|nr:hypothetical protein [Siminovitchia fordii]GIN22635.1 hypothetical protein J1TS3_37690 [Siminovitchia fordii]